MLRQWHVSHRSLRLNVFPTRGGAYLDLLKQRKKLGAPLLAPRLLPCRFFFAQVLSDGLKDGHGLLFVFEFGPQRMRSEFLFKGSVAGVWLQIRYSTQHFGAQFRAFLFATRSLLCF